VVRTSEDPFVRVENVVEKEHDRRETVKTSKEDCVACGCMLLNGPVEVFAVATTYICTYVRITQGGRLEKNTIHYKQRHDRNQSATLIRTRSTKGDQGCEGNMPRVRSLLYRAPESRATSGKEQATATCAKPMVFFLIEWPGPKPRCGQNRTTLAFYNGGRAMPEGVR
jgi:hypothetical protein